MSNFTLSPSKAGLLIVDMQEKLFSHVDRGQEVLHRLLKLINAFQILNIPIFLSEQYPEGLGSTILPIKTALGEQYKPWKKTTFSCLDDLKLIDFFQTSKIEQWIVVGIEAHICVLQTTKGLLKKGKEVTTLNDVITSRSIYDYSTGIAEMRDVGVRISSLETILFELVKDSTHPQFKEISQLVKTAC